MVSNIKETNSLISVIIPTYNRAHIVLKSINSVLNQTYKNIELIIVDDGSTDNTREVLESVDDGRFRFISLENNSGMCFARNAGASIAKGEYIAIHDSDDIWSEDKLEKQYSFMKKTNCDLSFCKMLRIHENGKEQIVPQNDIKVDNDFYRKLLAGNVIASITIIMTRQLAKHIKFDPEVRRFTDWDFALRVVKSGYKIGYLPEILATSYIQKDSTATTSNAYQSIKFIYERYKEDIDLYPEVRSMHLFNLGNSCSSNNRKLATKYYIESLRIKHSWKTLVHLILVKTGLMEFARIIKRKL